MPLDGYNFIFELAYLCLAMYIEHAFLNINMFINHTIHFGPLHLCQEKLGQLCNVG